MTPIDFLNKVHKSLDSQEYNLSYDDEDSNVWSAITNFSASATARKDLLRRLRSIKNQVPDEDGEREIVELWKESNNWESWDMHLDSLIELLIQE